MFEEHSGNIQEYSANIQEHSGNIRERSGNIQEHSPVFGLKVCAQSWKIFNLIKESFLDKKILCWLF
jgi:hypothetical protein